MPASWIHNLTHITEFYTTGSPLYGKFRFRISRADVGTGLNDVLTSGGTMANLFVARRKKTKHRSLLKFRDRYHWF